MERSPDFGAAVAPHPEGVEVAVWVVAGASRDAIAGIHDGALRVRVTAPAEGGKANRAVVRLVAAAVGGRRGRVSAGVTARRKTIVVVDVSRDRAIAALERPA